MFEKIDAIPTPTVQTIEEWKQYTVECHIEATNMQDYKEAAWDVIGNEQDHLIFNSTVLYHPFDPMFYLKPQDGYKVLFMQHVARSFGWNMQSPKVYKVFVRPTEIILQMDIMDIPRYNRPQNVIDDTLINRARIAQLWDSFKRSMRRLINHDNIDETGELEYDDEWVYIESEWFSDLIVKDSLNHE